ncbi:MAG: hypothetical protein JW727_01295 [Candidatus Aenigmarchaeota archaeon]|nr:hypothetical protein [Candidatus Aenigmarchaeota archaeon]
MKGALDTLTDYMYLIIALVIGAIMFYFIARYSGVFDTSADDVLFGDTSHVSKRLAEEIELCWENHRGGLDPSSDICAEIIVNATGNFTERTVTQQLDCKQIPNNICSTGNCSFCTSESYDDQDKLKWSVGAKDALVEISYVADGRYISVRDLNVFSSDNGNTGGNTSSAGNVTALISLPVNGTQYGMDETITFKAWISGGKAPYNYGWELDGKHLGNKSVIEVSSMDLGIHTATLKVDDAFGRSSEARVEFRVADSAGNETVGEYCIPLIHTGPSSSNLNVVFVGHGYVDLSKFRSDVQNHTESLLSYSPFKENVNKINVYMVNLSGDLGCYYNCAGIARLICCDVPKTKTFAMRCPSDQIIVLFDSETYGGGGYITEGISVVARSETKAAVHEFGHAFGKLYDEYSYGQPTSMPEEAPNCDESPSCTDWEGQGMDCIRECSYTNWYRPSDSCIMKDLGYGFCSVCLAQIESQLDYYGN